MPGTSQKLKVAKVKSLPKMSTSSIDFLRPLARIKLAESETAGGSDYCLYVYSASTFQSTDGKSILAEKLSGITVFTMALAETGGHLLQKSDMLLGQLETAWRQIFPSEATDVYTWSPCLPYS